MSDTWFSEAAKVAQGALCSRAKCGAIVVADNIVIGSGYNAPPRDDMNNAKCHDSFDRGRKPKYDITCCMHAEWRAITDALMRHPQKIQGATLYYVRLDNAGNIKPSGEPFCTVCSRLALDVGIARFGLLHKNGPELYDTKDYNDKSYAYHK